MTKSIDYSASAVKMCNPDEVKDELAYLHNLNKEIQEVEDEIKKSIPDQLQIKLDMLRHSADDITKVLRERIEIYGSYQDLEQGWYAIKQRVVSKSYNAGIFKEQFPKFAPVVIVEIVNEKALTGLIKGGLISEVELYGTTIIPPVIKESETFRFIIK